jgi:transposase
MAAHLREAAIELALLADENRLHRRLHVMGWTPPAFLPPLLACKRRKLMSLELLAIDLGKRSFHIHAVDSHGVVISRKTSRAKLIETIEELRPMTIAMEACASAHYWGRRFLIDGRRVLLINPRFVKPFVKGSKNDAADAEGIYEAALRPTMRFVPVKSTEQQDLQSLHRTRDRVVCARTALINHIRGLLGEYGVILPQGAWRFLAQAHDAVAGAELSDLTRELFADMLDELGSLDLRLDKLDRQLLAICRTNEACRRLSKLPGVGPVIATALVAAVDDGRHFRSGRELAAWIGLVPRQYTTGGKPRLGGIGRRANHYLRRQMIHGARAVMFRLTKHDDRRSQWLKGLAARRGFNRTVVALANKTARVAWVLLTRKEDYVAA